MGTQEFSFSALRSYQAGKMITFLNDNDKKVYVFFLFAILISSLALSGSLIALFAKMKGLGHFTTNIKPITGLFHTIQKGPLIAIAVTGSLVIVIAILRLIFNLVINNHKSKINRYVDAKDNNWSTNSKGERFGFFRQTLNYDKKTLAVLSVAIASTVGAGLALAKFDKAAVAINLFSVVGLILALVTIVSVVLKSDDFSVIKKVDRGIDKVLDAVSGALTCKSCRSASPGAGGSYSRGAV